MGNHIRDITQSRIKNETYIERNIRRHIERNTIPDSDKTIEAPMNSFFKFPSIVHDAWTSHDIAGVIYSNTNDHLRYIKHLKNKYPNINEETMNRLHTKYKHVLFIEFTKTGRQPLIYLNDAPVPEHILNQLNNVDMCGKYNGSKFTTVVELKMWIMLHNK